jgi:GNAT superfamily N-acetyltransferase
MQGHTNIEIGTIRAEEWNLFLRLAAAEGWQVPQWETELFRGAFADNAFALRSSGDPYGFITALCHVHNGWIGNLLVAEGYRGRGYGSALLDHALRSLRECGACCVWLTASAFGRPLYERRGFSLIDGVDRWARAGEGVSAPAEISVVDPEAVVAADARAWGGSRTHLLQHLANNGQAYSGGASLALLQAPGPMRVLGPWLKQTDDDDSAAILSAAIAMTSAGVEIVADVRHSAKLDTYLEQTGFRWQGYNALMAQGTKDHVELSQVFSLASLGSMG